MGDAGVETEASKASRTQRRFFALVLWLCAGAAAYLLVAPSSLDRRALAAQSWRYNSELQRQWLRNAGLERLRDGLEWDPSVIEREARKLGFGRPGEIAYSPTSADLNAVEPAGKSSVPGPSMVASILAEALFPVVALVIIAAIAVLFFGDLKIDDPNAQNPPEQGETT